MRMTGSGGELRAGGRLAASVGDWSFTGTPEAWELTGTATEVDHYWLNAAAVHRLTLRVGTRRWRWPAVRAAVDGAELTITGSGEAQKD